MPTTIADDVIRNAVMVERYKDGHIRAVMPILNTLSTRIETLILRMDTTSTRDINAKLRQIDTLIDAAFARIQTLSVGEYNELVAIILEQEEDTLALFFGRASDASISGAQANSIATLALATLSIGKTFKTHIRDLKAATKATIAADIRRGLADANTVVQVARGIKGTRSRRFKDGSFNRVLNNLSATISTSITGVVNKTKIEYYRAVGIDKFIWLSVLDGNTTDICISRSNKIYRVGLGPIPPAHYRCRSVIAPYKKGMKIPQSYREWLRKQPLADIEDILGKQKAQLFLTGKIKLDKFVSAAGATLTLVQLRARRKLKG